jgi:metal-responsive CopG/Arc/MetJ family transcriptional regulator
MILAGKSDMAVLTRNVTVSLPHHVLDAVDAYAAERSSSRSAVIAAWLQEVAERHLEDAMVEGYGAMAEESERVAAEFAPVVHAGLSRDA